MHNNEFRMITEDMERLKERVMSRVRIVRRIRAFLSSPVSSATFAIIFLLCANIFVSFTDIVHNIMIHGEWGSRLSYTCDAVLHTRIMVQIFAALTSVSVLVLLVKILFRLKTPVYFLGNFLTSIPLKLFRS